MEWGLRNTQRKERDYTTILAETWHVNECLKNGKFGKEFFLCDVFGLREIKGSSNRCGNQKCADCWKFRIEGLRLSAAYGGLRSSCDCVYDCVAVTASKNVCFSKCPFHDSLWRPFFDERLLYQGKSTFTTELLSLEIWFFCFLGTLNPNPITR